MMKKILALLIALVMILCLGACGGIADDTSQTEEAVETEEEEESPFFGEYTIVYFQSGPLILVDDNNDKECRIGALDSSGKFVIPFKYQEMIYLGKDRYMTVMFDEEVDWKYGIVDLEGNEILPCEYVSIEPTSEDSLNYFLEGYKEPEGEFVTVRKIGSDTAEYVSIIDGRSVSKPDESMMLTFDEAAMRGTYNGEVDNIKVPEEISNKYQDAQGIYGIAYGCNECMRYTNYRCNYYVVTKGYNEDMIVDADGREVGGGAVWAEVGYEFADGLIAVRKDRYGPWALIDSEGKEVTDYIFDVPLDMS